MSQFGIFNPGEVNPASSIEIAIRAAVGGRASLIGPMLGAFIVNGAKSWLTVAQPKFLLNFFGALSIWVTPEPPNVWLVWLKSLQERRAIAPGLLKHGACRVEAHRAELKGLSNTRVGRPQCQRWPDYRCGRGGRGARPRCLHGRFERQPGRFQGRQQALP